MRKSMVDMLIQQMGGVNYVNSVNISLFIPPRGVEERRGIVWRRGKYEGTLYRGNAAVGECVAIIQTAR